MRLLVNSANINSNDVVLEIGCGTGSLTGELVEKAGFVVAVELDRTLAGIAKNNLVKIDNIGLINVDILENKHTLNHDVIRALESARKKNNGRFLLVSNLPYNIASPTMMNLLTGPLVADSMYVTVQKEIADRMTALPGSDHYSILSIFMNAAGDAEVIRILKPSVFWPRPQVDSAMVGFVRNREKIRRIKDIDLFIETVSLFMGHRRKTLTTCSKLASGKLAGQSINWPEIFKRCDITPTNRPDKLSSEDYIAISNICFSALAET
jgi:16S rRNA (adenine1518-N6/adenine1519-N6)-dimethyltransferase